MRSLDTQACFTIAITIWALWYAHNRHVMEAKQQHALEISAKIISLVRELKELRAKLPEARITMKQSWTPPTDLMLKLNFDTTFHAQSQQSSSGFVVRNAQGQVLGSDGRDRSAIGVYVEEIKQKAKMFDKIIFRSVDRNTNQVAHILVKARSTFNEDGFWVEDVPDMDV
ncbi:hypothetical protein PVK06_043666 [Gossypium arboreum]|uniref:RNase H type-1 domain-containing protein n=1 Tax=Gossypium arboreum TaxID=29729 RepID=A0ABR0MQV8_GOSAR|nr:hypothetical protein PVK06_043666 [Gossypium arboreum]